MLTKDSHNYAAVIKTPFPGDNARLAVRVHQEDLLEISFVPDAISLKSPATTAAKEVVEQLNAYFMDPDYQFSMPLSPGGTSFQKRVWRLLRRCPKGKVWSYGDLAKRIKSGPRAVANACRRNPIPIIVPCHRIVSATGIGGYSGKTTGNYLKIKQWLLRHESAI
ncbi:methylated-DNA--[protein]-cysteine S-methyltransferase [Kaarinaea lacus]